MASSTTEPVLASLASASSNAPRLSGATLCPYPARAEATNWSVRVGCVYSGEACRTDQDRLDVGAYCPIHSMVREFYDYIIGDAPLWGDPVG